MASLYTLPTDVVTLILRELSISNILCFLASSKRLRHLHTSTELWSRLGITPNDRLKHLPIKAIYILSLYHKLDLMSQLEFLETLVKGNSLYVLGLILEYGRCDKNMIVNYVISMMILENNLYLLSWYIKTQQRYIGCIVRYCAFHGMIDLLQFAVKHIPLPYKIRPYITAVQAASSLGRLEIVKYLVQASPSSSVTACLDAAFGSVIRNFNDTNKPVGEWASQYAQRIGFEMEYEKHLNTACYSQNIASVEFVLSAHPSVNLYIALRTARNNNYQPIIRLLESHQSLRIKSSHEKEDNSMISRSLKILTAAALCYCVYIVIKS